MSFTGQLGTIDSMPGNIALGSPGTPVVVHGEVTVTDASVGNVVVSDE